MQSVARPIRAVLTERLSANEDLRAKVMSHMKNTLQPAISNIEIKWSDNSVNEVMEEKSDMVTNQFSSKIPPIFDGERLLAYHLYPSEARIPNMISMKADTPSGPLIIDIDIAEANMLDENGLVSIFQQND